MAHLTCYVNHGTAGAQGVRITPPEVIDATIPVELLTFATGAGGDPTSGNVSVLTDTNGQLRVRARGSTTTATIHLNGWTEDRSH